VPIATIYVNAVQEVGDSLDYLDEAGKVAQDGVGAYTHVLARAPLPAGKPLWFMLNVSARAPWEGELSVSFERGEPVRPRARAALRTRPIQGNV